MEYQYLGAYSIEDGKDLILTIKSAAKEEVKNEDGKADKCLVLYFKEVEKGMVVNATNAKRIEGLYKTGIVTEWVGKRIGLYVENVKAWGKVVPALRVREKAPSSDAELKIRALKAEIRAALTAYEGDDKADIVAMLKEKEQAGELTADLLRNTLKAIK